MSEIHPEQLPENAPDRLAAEAEALLLPPAVVLLDPSVAPPELLARVDFGPDAHTLVAATDYGQLTLALGYHLSEEKGSPRLFAEFRDLPINEQCTGEADDTRSTTCNPFVSVPLGSPFEFILQAPSFEWGNKAPVNLGVKALMLSADEVRQLIPGSISDDAEGVYTVTMSEQTRPTLSLAIRVNGDNPLIRKQGADSTGTVIYEEENIGGFRASDDVPEVDEIIIGHYYTLQPDKSKADTQRLKFVGAEQGDDFDGSGVSGVVEVIVFIETGVQYLIEISQFEIEEINIEQAEVKRSHSMGIERGSAGGDNLLPGRISRGAPKRVDMQRIGTKGDRVPIAAYRFPILGAAA